MAYSRMLSFFYTLFLYIYNIITTAIILILYFVFFFSSKFKNNAWRERLLLCKAKKTNNKIIWVHGASIGEILSVKNLILVLKNKYADYDILITSHTLTSKKIIEDNFQGQVIHHFLPIDNIFLINIFLKKYCPKLVLWIEQDFLPITLKKINDHNIPLLLLNGRISDKSFRIWKKFLFIIKPILDNFTNIFAMSLQNKKKFQYLSSKKIRFIGNLKYTSLKKEVSHHNYSEYQYLLNKYKNNKIFTALSTHYNEEDTIIGVHKQLKEKIDNLVTFILPRHKDRAKEIVSTMEIKYHKKIALYSDFKSCNEDNLDQQDIILVDEVGKVDIFSKLADIVFVGKSLSPYKKGGQNILEPLSLGKPVIFGNNMDNFSDVVIDCLKHNAGILLYNEKELSNQLFQLLSNDDMLDSLTKKTHFVFSKKKLVLNNYLKVISLYL